MRTFVILVLLALLPLLAPAAPALAAPPANVVTIVLSGANRDVHPSWVVTSLFPLPGPMACALASGPGSFDVSCTPPGVTSCVAWSVVVTTHGAGGFVAGRASCDNGPVSAAGTPKPGQAVGPVIVGPVQPPLNCGVTWVPGPMGGYTVTCIYVVT